MLPLFYLAQVSLYWLLLYGCYWLVLRRHTFFTWNRAYLLGSLLGAFALPLVPYPEVAPPVPSVVYEMAALPMETIPVVVVETQHAASLTPIDAAPFPWIAVLWIIYALGVVIMAVRLFRHLRQVRALLRQGTCLDMDAYQLYLLENNQTGSFSFLNHIAITPTDYEQNFETILTHELAHMRQRHSWDILLVEVLRVLFWFNPVLILYKKSLQQVHEYLADREVCAWEAASQRDHYAEFMVSYALGSPTATLVNPFFNSSLLKDRIVMLYKNRNSNWSLGKYAAVALLVGFVTLLAASCEQKSNENSETDEGTVATGQMVIIEGTITSTDATPLPGAEINVKGTQTGTTTTAKGEFIIRAPAGSELDFRFVGHKPTSLKVNEQGTVKVALAEETASEVSMAERVSSKIGSLGISPEAKKEPIAYSKDSVYTVVAETPEFPGGIKAMYKFIEDNMRYPEPARRANVEGKVFLTFVVNSDGSIQNIQVLKGLGFGCDEEAIRVMKQTPKWIPGEKADGEKVNVKYNLPISFVLPKNEKELSANVSVSKPKATTAVQRSSANAGADSLVGLRVRKPNYEEVGDKFIIRGTFTDQNAPLMVVDGVIQPIEETSTDVLGRISPNEIASINIIKDGSARTKYGALGVNGVVEITTKQGEQMPLEIKN
jgi:TonB family protein